MCNKRAAITGPTGSVGIYLIEELLDSGYDVTAICREKSARIKNMPKHERVRVVECNLDSLLGLQDVLGRGYDCFFHFGWDGTLVHDRQDLYRQVDNIRYSLDAVELANRIGCKVFVGAGSQSEFGHVNVKLSSTVPCNPDNGYGIAKLDAGRMSRIQCRHYGIKHIWCRIVSSYGAYDSVNTLVMGSITNFINGTSPAFTKGDQIWDFLYCKDLARMFRLLSERGEDGHVYCLGSGKSGYLRDYITAIRDIVNPKLAIRFGERGYYPNQIMHLETDLTEVIQAIGFLPEYSFEDGVKEICRKIRDGQGIWL